MADVRSRGQVILITGFALAVTLVAIVLLLNTVIYTENIATRGTDPSPREALQFRDTVIDGVGKVMIATNHQEYDDQSTVESNFDDAIANLTAILRAQQIGRGTVAVLNNTSMTTTPGRLLQQTNAGRNFSSGGTAPGNQTWRLAEDVNNTRRVRLFVTRSSLDSSSITDLNDLLANDSGFAVRLEGTTNWTAYIYENSGDITLATSTGGATPTERCRVDADNATVDLTGEGIVGVDCGSYDWADGISGNYTIWFLNGQNAKGTYNLTVQTTGPASIVTANFDDSTGSDPQALHAVYSATFPIRFETSTVTYETSVRVAPGEDDD